jgi:hypothetical protein
MIPVQVNLAHVSLSGRPLQDRPFLESHFNARSRRVAVKLKFSRVFKVANFILRLDVLGTIETRLIDKQYRPAVWAISQDLSIIGSLKVAGVRGHDLHHAMTPSIPPTNAQNVIKIASTPPEPYHRPSRKKILSFVASVNRLRIRCRHRSIISSPRRHKAPHRHHTAASILASIHPIWLRHG